MNFIDPLGLEGVHPEEWERVRLHINDLGGWFGGQGAGGHVFLEFPDRNLFRGNYPKRMEGYDQRHINANTTTFEYYCRPSKVTTAIDVMNQIKWSCSKNCVYTAVEGMKEMGFIHADKIRLSKILPLPSELRSQMLEFHGIDPRVITYPREKIEIKHPPPTSPPLSFNFSPSLDFGGVSLSKTAELQLKISDITGAAFDASTGQIVLFGPQERYLPQVDLDDLAVAVKSVYGFGNDAQDPGISIDPSPETPGQMKVRYDGATANTSFGQTIFEADYLLKCLVVGKNKATGQPFNLNVPGYRSALDRLAAHQWTGGQLDSVRLWFIPDQITLIETEDHKGMVFSDVRMKVMTEASLIGLPADHPVCQEFADHFTAHYDEFARELPILEKLKNLGKITAIVKWIRENKIPFDTSFFIKYQPKKVETPDYVSPIENSCQWTLKRLERRHVPGHRHKKDVEALYTQTIRASGGVVYRLNSQNYATYRHPTAQEFTSSVLKSRPSENDFSWTFKFPTNRETFIAVAQSIYRTKKPGNVKKSYTDLSFSVPGEQKLSLQRFYNSFSEKESPFGIGWRMIPYELELPTEKIPATTHDRRTFVSYSKILVRTPEGEDFYQLYLLSDSNLPIFKSPVNSNFLQDNLNGTFTLIIPHRGRIDFDSHGRLLKVMDANGVAIEYEFSDQNLTSIHHQNGATIELEYEGNLLIKASGPGNSVVQYAYHSNGQLAAVGDAHKIYLRYSYDSDNRLNRITDHLNNVLFEANYDDYNRAILVKEGSMSYQSDFSLEKKSMKRIDNQGNETTFQFDDKDRLVYKKDPSGLIWKFFYDQSEFCSPTKIIDPKGGITECHYDPSGNLIYLKNPVGAEWRFFFDDWGNCLCGREPNGRAIWNTYRDKNRLIQRFLKVAIDVDENDHFALGFRGLETDGRYAECFSYDDQTGQLISRTNSRGATTSFTYDKTGQQKGILFPTGYRAEQKIDEKGKIVEISDGFGIQKSYDYDEYDRVKAIQTAAGSTCFTYDDGGNLRMLVDPKGFTTSYDYDNQRNLKKVTDAEGGSTSYEYNSLDQLTHFSLPNGACKTIKYDSLGRLEQEIWGIPK